jgi:hypothetical protein
MKQLQWNVWVEPKTNVNCWRKTGNLPFENVEVVVQSTVQSSGDKILKMAALLTEFAASAAPDMMEAQEFLDVDGDVSTEAAEEEVSARTSDESSEEEEQAAPNPVTRALAWPRLLSLFK